MDNLSDGDFMGPAGFQITQIGRLAPDVARGGATLYVSGKPVMDKGKPVFITTAELQALIDALKAEPKPPGDTAAP